MMRGASGDECGNLVLGQEYNRPAEAGVLKKPRGSDFNFYVSFYGNLDFPTHFRSEDGRFLFFDTYFHRET
jgi:hypothetical protein